MSAKLKRRDFITLLGGAAAWPVMAHATGRASRGAWSEMVATCLGATQLPVLDGMRDGAPG